MKPHWLTPLYSQTYILFLLGTQTECLIQYIYCILGAGPDSHIITSQLGLHLAASRLMKAGGTWV